MPRLMTRTVEGPLPGSQTAMHEFSKTGCLKVLQEQFCGFVHFYGSIFVEFMHRGVAAGKASHLEGPLPGSQTAMHEFSKTGCLKVLQEQFCGFVHFYGSIFC